MPDNTVPKSTEKLDLATRAAWLYYVAGNTQNEIAEKLQVSRPVAQRLVAFAVEKNLIRVRVDHPLADCLALADKLSKRYGLSVCEVVPVDNDTPEDVHWSYIGTFDNNATINELRFLAKVAAAADETTGARWRAAVRRGIEYALAAQYPNGGWPQNFPLDGGYHDAITFNDGAIENIIEFVRDVAAGKNEFAWVPAELRQRAATAEARGVDCILACQLVVDGRRTVWCQQHDMLTLAPASARNYEMPSQSGAESAGLAVFLMELPKPDARVVTAVHAAAQWFQKTALRDVVFRPAPDGSGRKLLPSPGAGPIWARYYELKTDRPIFGDRDKSIHDDISEISQERRNGYSWFNNGPQRALDHYAKWAPLHPEK